MSSSQSKERTMLFRTWKQRYVQSEATEVCEFPTEIPVFCRRLQLAAPSLTSFFADIQREKFFSKSFFLVKKCETSRKLEWNSFVCFIVDEYNCRQPEKQQRKLLLLLLCLLFSLSLHSNQPFPIVHSVQKRLTLQYLLLVILGYLISLPSLHFWQTILLQ